jgi:hypothetical protein
MAELALRRAARLHARVHAGGPAKDVRCRLIRATARTEQIHAITTLSAYLTGAHSHVTVRLSSWVLFVRRTQIHAIRIRVKTELFVSPAKVTTHVVVHAQLTGAKIVK